MRTAILTITRNEAFFLPLWMAHYRRQLPESDIFILNHETNDQSIAKLIPDYSFTNIPVRIRLTDDVYAMRFLVQTKIGSLFEQGYDWVIFAEVDEFLAVAPEPQGHPETPEGFKYPILADLLADSTASHNLRATGLCVRGDRDPDPYLTLHEPILKHRSFVPDQMYDKTLILSRPVRWEVGFHNVEGGNPPITPQLYLIHLHWMNRELAWNRLAARREGRECDPAGGLGIQNKLPNRHEFDRYYDMVMNCNPSPFHDSWWPLLGNFQ